MASTMNATQQSISEWRNKDGETRQDNDGRIYSSFTRTPYTVRRALRIDDEPIITVQLRDSILYCLAELARDELLRVDLSHAVFWDGVRAFLTSTKPPRSAVMSTLFGKRRDTQFPKLAAYLMSQYPETFFLTRSLPGHEVARQAIKLQSDCLIRAYSALLRQDVMAATNHDAILCGARDVEKVTTILRIASLQTLGCEVPTSTY